MDYSQASPRPPSGLSNPYISTTTDTAYTGAMFIPDNQPAPSYAPQTGASGFEDEPPLLEELGINPYHILWEALLQLHLWDRVDGLPRHVLSTEPNVPLRSFYRVCCFCTWLLSATHSRIIRALHSVLLIWGVGEHIDGHGSGMVHPLE